MQVTGGPEPGTPLFGWPGRWCEPPLSRVRQRNRQLTARRSPKRSISICILSEQEGITQISHFSPPFPFHVSPFASTFHLQVYKCRLVGCTAWQLCTGSGETASRACKQASEHDSFGQVNNVCVCVCVESRSGKILHAMTLLFHLLSASRCLAAQTAPMCHATCLARPSINLTSSLDSSRPR